jgi:beta-galactosidase
MKRYISDKVRHFLHGADYNPDQWYKQYPEIIKEDMRLMKKAHCNVMSVGIFAWAALEPEEGKYDFTFLDQAMDNLASIGAHAILATPSGAKPAWLSQKYPEVLRYNEKFQQMKHGLRHNHCYTSPIYREKIAQMNRALAERYKDHPALLMWHVSNEYGGKCYCPNCQKAFREWLKDKYKTLDNLNHEWWTAFWAHTYTAWDQIEPPSVMGETATHGLTVDWKRFVSYQTTDFMKAEIAALREITPNVPVTANLMGFYYGLDYRVLAKEIDVASWDCYPFWRGDNHDITLASDTAMVHDLNRSLLHRPFMLMESTPSHVNWSAYNKLKRPGQHIQGSLQAIAHGSDTVQYFQWRKSRGSSEKFHGAVVDHEGSENSRVFREVSALGARLETLSEIVGTDTQSRVGILYDWSNHWALDSAQGFQLNDKKLMPTMQNFYRPLWKRGINVDILSYEDDFSNYDLLIAPMIYMVPTELEEKLVQFVANGGTLLGTYTLGMVNENDLCHLGGFPCGKLKDVFGLWNEEIDTLYPDDKNSVTVEGKSYDAIDYCEVIHPTPDTEVLGTYAQDFYANTPAVTRHAYGKGQAYYVAFRDCGDFSDEIVSRILAQQSITSDFDGVLCEGVTAHSRTDGEKVYIFLENFAPEAKAVAIPTAWRDFENGTVYEKKITLAANETKILTR